MKKIALVALGALAITGCDFAGDTADTVALSVGSIQAENLSAPAGVADADGMVDAFVEIQNAAGQTVWRSATQNDADASQLTFNVPEAVQVGASTQALSIAVWDYDTDYYTGSQLIARSQTFTAEEMAAQPQITRTAGTGTVTIRSAAAQ